MKLDDCKRDCKGFHENETWVEWKRRTGYGVDIYKQPDICLRIDINLWLKKAKRSQKRGVYRMQVPPGVMISALVEIKELRSKLCLKS